MTKEAMDDEFFGLKNYEAEYLFTRQYAEPDDDPVFVADKIA